MYAGIVLILLSIGLLFVSPFLPIPQDAKLLAIKIATALIIGGAVMEIVGPLFCLATPQETGAAGYIYVSVAALIGSLALQGAALLQALEKIPALPPALGIVQPILGVLSGLTFMLFLQRLNTFIGRPDLVQSHDGFRGGAGVDHDSGWFLDVRPRDTHGANRCQDSRLGKPGSRDCLVSDIPHVCEFADVYCARPFCAAVMQANPISRVGV